MTVKVAPFRVLVVDNDALPRAEAEQAANLVDGLTLSLAGTVDEAYNLIDNQYFNLACVDLRLSDENLGAETGRLVLRRLRRDAPSCARVVMTKWAHLEYRTLLEMQNDDEPPVVHHVHNKSGERGLDLRPLFLRFARDTLKADWEIAGLDELLARLDRVRGRRGYDGLRSSSSAVRDEMKHLLFRLLWDLRGVASGQSLACVTLSPLDGGRSSAVVAEAVPRFEVDGGRFITGNRCVIKIGPRTAIEEEAGKFRSFVQFGVPNTYRVELMASAGADALGAVCYSFAGGNDADVESLSELLGNNEISRASAVMARVFAPDKKRWYAVPGPDQRVRSWYADSYRADFELEIRRMREWAADQLAQHVPGCRITQDNRMAFGREGVTDTLVMPTEDALGAGSLGVTGKTCLVHGDLHTGNVVISRQSPSDGYFIDFANVGFGPRFVDAAAMLASLRTDQAEAVRDDERREWYANFADLVALERRIARRKVGRTDPEWAKTAQKVDLLVTRNFVEDVRDRTVARERLATFTLAGVSLCGLKRWNAVQRSWLTLWACVSFERVLQLLK